MNQQVTVSYTLPKAAALAAGSPRYGNGEFPLTEEQIAELPRAEALFLASSPRLTLSAPPTWGVVREAIREAAQKADAERAARAAQVEAAVAAGLSLPLEEWLTAAGVGMIPYAALDAADDPRVQARKALAHEFGASKRAAIEAAAVAKRKAEQAERDRRDAEAAEAERAKAAFVEACARFALSVPELARPASEGYNVTGAVLAHVCDDIAGALSRVLGAPASAEVIREGSKAWEAFAWSEQAAPNARAFRVYDAVKAHLPNVKVPEGLTVDLLRVMRVEKTLPDLDDDGEKQVLKFTGVVVYVAAPGQKDRAVVFDTET